MDLAIYSQSAATAHRNRQRILQAGVNMRGYKLWTSSEDAVLRKYHPDFDKLSELFPNRTRVALWNRCRELGMKRDRHRWLASDISKLRRIYPNGTHAEICAEFPGLCWNCIRVAALYYGLRRKKRGYRRTGNPLIDSLLARVEEIGWTLKDLDEEAGTGRYFHEHAWRRYELNYQAFAKAIRALDGDIHVKWKDRT